MRRGKGTVLIILCSILALAKGAQGVTGNDNTRERDSTINIDTVSSRISKQVEGRIYSLINTNKTGNRLVEEAVNYISNNNTISKDGLMLFTATKSIGQFSAALSSYLDREYAFLDVEIREKTKIYKYIENSLKAMETIRKDIVKTIQIIKEPKKRSTIQDIKHHILNGIKNLNILRQKEIENIIEECQRRITKIEKEEISIEEIGFSLRQSHYRFIEKAVIGIHFINAFMYTILETLFRKNKQNDEFLDYKKGHTHLEQELLVFNTLEKEIGEQPTENSHFRIYYESIVSILNIYSTQLTRYEVSICSYIDKIEPENRNNSKETNRKIEKQYQMINTTILTEANYLETEIKRIIDLCYKKQAGKETYLSEHFLNKITPREKKEYKIYTFIKDLLF